MDVTKLRNNLIKNGFPTNMQQLKEMVRNIELENSPPVCFFLNSNEEFFIDSRYIEL